MELLKLRLQLLLVILACFSSGVFQMCEAIVNFGASAQSRPSISLIRGTASRRGSSTPAISFSSGEFAVEEVQLSRHRTSTAPQHQYPDPELQTPPPPAFSASIANTPDIRAPDMEQEFGSSSEGNGSGGSQMDMTEFQKLVAKAQQQESRNPSELPKGLELIDLHYGVFEDNLTAGGQGSEAGESRQKEVVGATSEDASEQEESESDEENWKNGKFMRQYFSFG